MSVSVDNPAQHMASLRQTIAQGRLRVGLIASSSAQSGQGKSSLTQGTLDLQMQISPCWDWVCSLRAHGSWVGIHKADANFEYDGISSFNLRS